MNLVSQHDLQMIAIWEASNSLSLLEDTVSPKAVGCILGVIAGFAHNEFRTYRFAQNENGFAQNNKGFAHK